DARRTRKRLARDEAEVQQRVAEGLGLLPLRQRLLDVLARDLAGAEKDLVDRVGAVVRARREHVARLEVENLDDAVLLEAERAGEMLAPKLHEALDDVDIANLPFQLHARDYRRSEGRRQKAEVLAVIARLPPGLLPSALCPLPFHACNSSYSRCPTF